MTHGAYIRNGFGETKRQASPDSGNTDYVRDLRGLVTQKTDGRLVVTNMTYDNAGRMLTKTFPTAATENVTFTYDSVLSGNFGKGRLTGMTHEGGSIARTYDARGNVVSDVRTITGAGAKTVAYQYSAADLVTQITYPSGRIVTYTRDTTGRITGVTTKLNSGAAAVNVATSITYQPVSNLIKSLTYGNSLVETDAHTLDYEQSQCSVTNGVTPVVGLTFGRTDNLNLTAIGDTVTTANNQSFAYSPANRLNSASGAYGSQTWIFDGVGNRTSQTIAGVTDTYTYPATNNKVQSVVRNAVTQRSFTYDNAGNMATDTRSGVPYTYGYNNANRLKTVTQSANLLGTYTYNGFEQLIGRVITNSGAANGTVFTVHDVFGNVLAELNATGATVREYIWLPEAEIAPTRGSRTNVDRPMAVVSNVNVSPALLMVHVDHLHRPVKMTNAAGTIVWNAVWQPWGGAHTLTGAEALDARFPGQWFQLEAGLHYNWHRHYDPSLGRYTQPDPLGFVDGPSVYAYALNSAIQHTDPSGLNAYPPSGDDPEPPSGYTLTPKPPQPPSSDNQCHVIPERPGDCTPERHRELQDNVDYYCNLNQNCDDLRLQWGDLVTRRDRALTCGDARTIVNNECFRGGNKNHRDQADNAYRAFRKCAKKVDKYRWAH